MSSECVTMLCVLMAVITINTMQIRKANTKLFTHTTHTNNIILKRTLADVQCFLIIDDQTQYMSIQFVFDIEAILPSACIF